MIGRLIFRIVGMVLLVEVLGFVGCLGRCLVLGDFRGFV